MEKFRFNIQFVICSFLGFGLLIFFNNCGVDLTQDSASKDFYSQSSCTLIAERDELIIDIKQNFDVNFNYAFKIVSGNEKIVFDSCSSITDSPDQLRFSVEDNLISIHLSHDIISDYIPNKKPATTNVQVELYSRASCNDELTLLNQYVGLINWVNNPSNDIACDKTSIGSVEF